MSTGEIGPKGALVEALRRFGDILQRADAASAELVEINENANDGSNEPMEHSQKRVHFDVVHETSIFSHIWEQLPSLGEAEASARRCLLIYPLHVVRIDRVTREVVETIDGCGHA